MAFDIARIFLGLVFFFFGLNGFFNWWPLPKMNLAMMKFNEALQSTQIIMPVVKIFEVVFGACLLLNQFPFLASLAVLPICFFIILAHLCFNRPKGLIVAGVFTFVVAIFVHHYWQQWTSLVQ